MSGSKQTKISGAEASAITRAYRRADYAARCKLVDQMILAIGINNDPVALYILRAMATGLMPRDKNDRPAEEGAKFDGLASGATSRLPVTH